MVQLPPHELWPLKEAASGRRREWWIAHGDGSHDAGTSALLARWIAMRQSGWPIAYLTGAREFYGRSFWVNRHTLIPRIETELLVDTAIAALKEVRTRGPAPRLCDLGTGSGCIGISLALECPDLQVTLSDTSAGALGVARNNAAWLGAAARMTFQESSWWDRVTGRFHGIVSNPPYIAAGDSHLTAGDLRFEPALALSPLAMESDALGRSRADQQAGLGAESGLYAIAQIVAGAPAHLEPSGFCAIEHGHDQQAQVMALFQSAGFGRIKGLRDGFGNPRVVLGWLQ